MKFYWIISNIRNIKRKILTSLESEVGEARVMEAFRGFTIRKRTYHTWPLFQTFLHQVASGMSCSEAVAWGIGQGLLPVTTSPKTPAYSNARGRLPEVPIRELMISVGTEVEGHAHKRDRVFDRNVIVVDGTSVQLPDTEANQAEYPQPGSQKVGCGQPVMFICALMGLATGAILDVAVGADHERVLFRKLWQSLSDGDILLGDRGFGSYMEVAMLLKRGIDFVFRQKQKSLKNKKLRKIGKDEWLVTWKRPKKVGDWVNPCELPPQMILRAIRFKSERKGFRSKEIILFTSLTDRKKYPKEKLMRLYYRRWEMELRFRDVKTTMGLELLRSKTPSGCRKELGMGLLAYNLVRAIMLDASLRGRLPISRISFKGALRWLDAYTNGWMAGKDPGWAYCLFLDHLIKAMVPDRPGRNEPRQRKRRPKNNYPLLTEPRKPARIEALHA